MGGWRVRVDDLTQIALASHYRVGARLFYDLTMDTAQTARKDQEVFRCRSEKVW
jgi:hypothetical protein